MPKMGHSVGMGSTKVTISETRSPTIPCMYVYGSEEWNRLAIPTCIYGNRNWIRISEVSEKAGD